VLGIDRGNVVVTINRGWPVNYQLPIDKVKKEFYSMRLNRPEPVMMALGVKFDFI
jgi:hypothetical protein